MEPNLLRVSIMKPPRRQLIQSTGKCPLLDSEPAMTLPDEIDEGFFLIFVEDDGINEIGYGRS